MGESQKSDRKKRLPDSLKKTMLCDLERVTVPIYYDGKDVTPKRFYVASITSEESDWSEGLLTSTTNLKSEAKKFTSRRQTSNLVTTQSMLTVDNLQLVVEDTSQLVSTAKQTQKIEITGGARRIPTKISLILNETDTIFLLDKFSTTATKGTEEGDLVEEDNRQYDYLTRGKGKNRKMFNVEIQTVPKLQKSRSTNTVKTTMKSDGTFASNWEMYDTYNKPSQATTKNVILSDKFIDVSQSVFSVTSNMVNVNEEQLANLIKCPTFLEAVQIMERILANNCYNEQQKRFRYWTKPDPLRKKISYEYGLDLLWTFAHEDIKGKSVSAMEWNLANPDILAVGYGVPNHEASIMHGFVMIWNIKNPTQPERKREFSKAVTCLAFGKINCDLLAVGFYDGMLRILDVSTRALTVIVESSYDTSPNFDPLWNLIWHSYDGEKEDILAVFENGRVFKYDIVETCINAVQIMRTLIAEGKLKGIQRSTRKCLNDELRISEFTSATTIAMHPVDNYTYFIGTGEGILYRCSLNYFGRHADTMQIAEGSVSFIKFSPFANKLFMSAGGDGYWRVWALSISEPIMQTSVTLQPINDGCWSPSHSTIIASVRGEQIIILDFRGTLSAQRVIRNPLNVANTIVRFSNNGSCLTVGDVDGNVHVYAIENLPPQPFFQENYLSQRVMAMLLSEQEVQAKFRSLNGLNFSKEEFGKYFN